MAQLTASAVSGASSAQQARPAAERERFSAEELAVVLSHYDLGVIHSITEFAKGSRRAPKVLIDSEQGKFLLKRRGPGHEDPFRVAFCHSIQLHLAVRQFPLPNLIGTRKENNSMVQHRGQVYELFEHIVGFPYPQTLEATFDSGRVLALFHGMLEGFTSQWQPGQGSYHAMELVERSLRSVPETLAQEAGELLGAYQRAGAEAERAGLGHWPKQIVHADWHPGNMLFRENQVVAVIDYDSARILPKVIDVANGALQFSIIGGEENVSAWPAEADEARFAQFLAGYDSVMLLSKGELRAIPWLMIETLIAEAALPIAATGCFGRTEGLTFLRMVRRKVEWLENNLEKLGAGR